MGEFESAAARNWRESLALWAIPEDILDQASESPWECPPEMFEVDTTAQRTLSTERALEVLQRGDTVLDVGVGGGAASLPLCPPATSILAVDQSAAMLDHFSAHAGSLEIETSTIEGTWPQVASRTAKADVVVSNNVLYNVAELIPFVQALSDHARRRVVLQISALHPRASLKPFWQHFWQRDLPDSPSASEALEVVREAGFDAKCEYFAHQPRHFANAETRVKFLRRQLCLTSLADGEIVRLLEEMPQRPLQAACIWWDVPGLTGLAAQG